MKRLPFAMLISFLLAFPIIGQVQGRILRFEKTIGAGREEGWMSFVAFNRDGTMVASDGPATEHDPAEGLTLWSFPDGRFVRKIPFRPWAISDDWKYYASAHAVIDVESGKPLIALTRNDDEWALPAFSHDGRYVAFAAFVPGKPADAKQIRILRIPDGTLVQEFGKRAVFSIAFHPDDEMLATGHWDNVTLWNARTGERIALLRGFERYVYGIGFSRDGKWLAAGTDDGHVQIWDLTKRRKLRTIDLMGGQVSAPAFSPDGNLLAAGVYGAGTVFVIDVRSGTILGQAHVSDLGCGSVAFSPDGRYLITPSTGGLITWPYDKGGTIRVFEVR
jgi:WD40 repeat protein